jgi:hypothetical protein
MVVIVEAESLKSADDEDVVVVREVLIPNDRARRSLREEDFDC